MNFNSLNELKMRLLPALRNKKEELEKLGYKINEDDIWDDLALLKWSKSSNLKLNDMVNDILKYEINRG